MPGTPSDKYGLTRIAGGDSINAYPALHNAAIDEIDDLMATISTADPRPDPGKLGRIHRAATGVVSFDTGVDWIEFATTAGVASSVAGLSFVGAIVMDAGTGDILTAEQEWMRPDGRLIDRTTYATYFGRSGHAHNGGVDPGSNKVRIPDYRGRSPVVADNLLTALGAAGRLPNSNRARGQNGGNELHAHTVNLHSHGINAEGEHVHFMNDTVSGPSTTATIDNASGSLPIAKGDHTHSTFANTFPGGGHSHGGNTGNPSDRGMSNTSSLHPYAVDNCLVRVR